MKLWELSSSRDHRCSNSRLRPILKPGRDFGFGIVLLEEFGWFSKHRALCVVSSVVAVPRMSV